MTIKCKENRLIIENNSWAVEKMLVKKLDRVVEGITQNNPKEDAFIINEGQEGKGKTNTSVVEAAWVKAKTKRDIHLFFNLEPMMNFAKNTKEKIIIWDEPSLDTLSTDHVKKINKDLTRLFMTIRKKRHFFIINYTKFWKFPEYIVVDRANGMVHMRPSKIGRFLFIRKKKLEKLWNDKKKSSKRSYKKCSSFGGSMPNIMEDNFKSIGIHVNEIKNATYDDYESEKDKAIKGIGEEGKTKTEIRNIRKLNELRLKISAIPKKLGISQLEFANKLGVNVTRIREWQRIELSP